MDSPHKKGKWDYSRLHETFFALNLGYAAVYVMLVCIAKNHLSWDSASSIGYYFSRGAARINNLLHIDSRISVSSDMVARAMPSPWTQLGEELVIVLSVFSIAAIVSLVMWRLSAGWREFVLRRLAGATALFALPMSYMLALRFTWNWPKTPSSFYTRSDPFWRSPELITFAVEIAFAVLVALATRRHAVSKYLLIILAFFHYVIWIPILWPNYTIALHSLIAPYLLFLTFPISGTLWWIHRTGQEVSSTTATKWRIVSAAFAGSVLVFLWSPLTVRTLAQPKDMTGVRIEMSRGPCYGRCPSYTVTIEGNGKVRFVGDDVKVNAQAIKTISSDQVRQVLQTLDDVDFDSLDDSAFTWCYDTPSVAARVTIDGSTKRIVSDAGCFGAPWGPQARFVQATDQIDSIIGSAEWLECHGRRSLCTD